ncbi:hypothetical protein ABK040_011085 [Willaertia magna]
MAQTNLWQQPYVNIVKFSQTTQDKSLQLKTEGNVIYEMDKEIGKSVYRIRGSVPSNHYISFPSVIPKNKGDGLGLIGQFCYLQIRPFPKEVFAIHVEINTKDELCMRFSFSNIYKQVKKTHSVVFIPIENLSDKWTVLSLDLKELVKKHLDKVYKCIRGVVVCSNLSLKNVFTSDNIYSSNNIPRDFFLPTHKGEEWNNVYDWIWVPTEPVSVKLAHIIDPDTLKKPSHSFNTSRVSSSFLSTTTNASKRSKPNTNISNKSLLTPNPILESKRFIGFDCKHNSNLVWTSDARFAIFPCGSSLIKMDVETGIQSILQGHTHNIISITTDYKCSLLVSIQNSVPLIRIWDIETEKCLAVLKAQESEINCITLSDNGNVLIGVGKDKQSKTQFIIWDISKIRSSEEIPIISKLTCDYHVNKVKFVPFEETKFVTCGKENIRLWRLKGGNVRGCSLQVDNPNLMKQNFLDVAFEKVFASPGITDKDHRFYLGTESGSLYQVNYDKRTFECVYQLHNGAINTLFINEGICITGSTDKYVRVWPLDFSDFFIEAELESSVMSVVTSKDGFKALISDSNGSIGTLEINTQVYKPVLRSHTEDVIDIAADPNRREFASVSKDRTIRVWDLESLTQKYQFDIDGEEKPLCLTYHRNDYILACGFMDGIIRIFDLSLTQVIEEYKAHNSDILAICYSTDSRWLISASKESICVSDTLHLYQPVKVISFSSECKTTCISLSRDGRFLACIGPSGSVIHVFSCKDFEELYLFETSADFFECITFTPDSKEIIASTSDKKLLTILVEKGEIISETEYSSNSIAHCLDTSQNGKYLITGGDDRLVRVWNCKDLANFSNQKFIGHISGINKVIFSTDYSNVLSCGQDGIIVWNFLGDKSRDLNLMLENHIERKLLEREQDEEYLDEKINNFDEIVLENGISNVITKSLEAKERIHLMSLASTLNKNNINDTPVNIENNTLVRLDTIPFKQYQLNRVPYRLPSERDIRIAEEPKVQPLHIVGYNGNARDNLLWIEKFGLIVYTSGNNIIVENLTNREQKHLIGHEYDISHLALHPNGILIASASVKAHFTDSTIIFWSLETLSPVKRIDFHKGGTVAMDFSPDGKYFSSIGFSEYDNRNVLAIWSVETGKLVANTLLPDPVYSIKWFPTIPTSEFITVGLNSITFWYLNPEGQLLMSPSNVDRYSITGSHDIPIHFTSIGFSIDYSSVWIGSNLGTVLVFNIETNELEYTWTNAHEGTEIDHIMWQNNFVLTSGTDKLIKRWKCTKRDKMYQLVLREQMELDNEVISVQFDERLNQGVVGTSCNTIWYLNWEQQQCIKLVSSHVSFVTGMANASEYLSSCSRDGTIKLWSKNALGNSWFLEQVLDLKRDEKEKVEALCIDKSKVNDMFVVGFSDGSIYINQFSNFTTISKKIKPHEEAITAIAINQNNRIICGSSNGLLTVIDNFIGLKDVQDVSNVENKFIFIRDFSNHKIGSIDYDEKTRRFVNTTITGLVCVWDDTDLTQIAKFAPHIYSRSIADKENFSVNIIAKFSPIEDDVVLITAPSKTNPKVEFYNYKREYCVRVFDMQRFVNCISISSIHNMIAFGTRDRLLVLMNYRTGEFEEYHAHNDSIKAIVFDDILDKIYSGSHSELIVWKVNKSF